MMLFTLIASYVCLPFGLTKIAFASSEFEGLLISPATMDIELGGGESYTGKLAVKNSTSSSMEVSMSVGSYNLDDGNYDSPDYDDVGQYNEIVNWISLDKDDFTLQPNEMAIVQYRIETPKDPPSGTQYAVIFASVGDSRIGMVIQALVQGGNVIKDTSVRNRTSMFQATNQPTVDFIVVNKGNVVSNVDYKVSISSASTGKTVGEAVGRTSSVYPGTSRRYNIELDKKLDWGVYNVEIRVDTVDGGRVIRKTIVLEPLTWYIELFLQTLQA